MISDLGQGVHPEDAKLLKFVDDSKAMKASKTPDDIQRFQVALDELSSWEEDNNMTFNTTKFQLIRLGANKALKEGTKIYIEKPSLFSPDKPLEESRSVKDLGIMVDSDASFIIQRNSAVNKAQRKAAWVLRTFITRSRYTLVQLWKSLIQPHLDYCSQLYSPTDLNGQLRLMEQPLRAYSRRIHGCSNLDYWERLAYLKLLSTTIGGQRDIRFSILGR